MNNPLLRVSRHAATPCCYHLLLVRTYTSLVVLHDHSPEIVPHFPPTLHHHPSSPEPPDNQRAKSNNNNSPLHTNNPPQPSQNRPNKNNHQKRQPNRSNDQNRKTVADTHRTQPPKEQPHETFHWNKIDDSGTQNPPQQTTQSNPLHSNQPNIAPQINTQKLNRPNQLTQPKQPNQPNQPNQPKQLNQSNQPNQPRPFYPKQPRPFPSNHSPHANHLNQTQQNIVPSQQIRTQDRATIPNMRPLPNRQLPQKNQLQDRNTRTQQNSHNPQNQTNQTKQAIKSPDSANPHLPNPLLQTPKVPTNSTHPQHANSLNSFVTTGPGRPILQTASPQTNSPKFSKPPNSPSPALQTPPTSHSPAQTTNSANSTAPPRRNAVVKTPKATDSQSSGSPVLQTPNSPTNHPSPKMKPPVLPEDRKAREAFKTARAAYLKSKSGPFMEVVEKFKSIQQTSWRARDEYFSFLVWGTDPKVVLHEFLHAKSIAPAQQLPYMYTRMLYFLAYTRSTKGKKAPENSHPDYELCDECLASMRKDGIAFDQHVYNALLLHADPDKRAQIFAQMYSDRVPCDENLLALALLSGDLACAADAVQLLRGRAWLRFRGTSWYIYMRARKTADDPLSTEDWPTVPRATPPLQTPETPNSHTNANSDTPTSANSDTPSANSDTPTSANSDTPTSANSDTPSANSDTPTSNSETTKSNTTDFKPTNLNTPSTNTTALPLTELTIPLARVKELALYLIAQGDEVGCAGLHSDLAAQGVQPFPELYDALLRFASQRNDAQTIDSLLAEKEHTGLPTTLDDYRALLAESDAWVRPAPVTQLVYVPPYLPYFHPQDPPLDNTPPSIQPPQAPQENLDDLLARQNLAGAHDLVRSLNGPVENVAGLYEKLLTAAALECNVQMCRALLDEFAQREATQRIRIEPNTQYGAATRTISADVRGEVMHAMNKRSQWNDSLRVFYEMHARGLKPTAQACTAAALALRHSQQPGRARRVHEILRENGIPGSPSTYSCLLMAAASEKDMPIYNAVWTEMEAHGQFIPRAPCDFLLRQFRGEQTWHAQAQELSRKMAVWWPDTPRSPSPPSSPPLPPTSPPSPPTSSSSPFPPSPPSSSLSPSFPRHPSTSISPSPSSPPRSPTSSPRPPPSSPRSPAPSPPSSPPFSLPTFSPRSSQAPPTRSPSPSRGPFPSPNLTTKTPSRPDPRRAKSAQPFPLDLYFTPTPPRIQDFFKKCKEISKEGAEREKALAELKKERDVLDKECAQKGNDRFRGDIHGAWLLAVGLEKTKENVREARKMGVKITRFMLNRLIAFYETKGDLEGMLRAKNQLVEAGFAPNSATYVPILAQLLTRRDRAGLERELQCMPVELIPEVYVPIARARAISALLRRGAVDACIGVLNDAESAEGSCAATQALNAALEDACTHGFGAHCLDLLPLIRKRIVKPDGVTYAAISNCLSLEKVHVVRQFYTYAKLATQMNDHAYALFACAFARSDPAQVRAVLRDLRESKLPARSATFDPILGYYATQRDVSGFTEILAEMKTMKITRNIGTLRAQMNLYAAVGDVQRAKKMLREMHEEGIKITPNFLTFYNPFLSLLATHGDPTGCMQVLTELRAHHGSHVLAKYYVYGSLYISLLAFSGSRSILLRLYKSGEHNIQKLIEETLRKMKGT